jgi:hypothetical protein
MTRRGPPLTRDERAANLMTNYAMLFASLFEGAFADIAVKMSEATVGMGEAIADAMSKGLSEGSGGSEMVKRTKKAGPEIRPDVSGQIKKMFSGIRDEVSSKMSENAPELKAYLANPAFDQGIAIVEKYDFGRPKFTERLSDEDLASYLVLLKSGDEALGKMFTELGQWQESLPNPPGRD